MDCPKYRYFGFLIKTYLFSVKDFIHSELLIAQDNTTGAYYLLGLHSHSDFVKPVVNDSGSLHYYYNVTYFGDWIAHEIETYV